MSNATKIMIIRHAEKPTTTPPPPLNGVTITGKQDKDSLIPRGWQRAGALVTLFAPARGHCKTLSLQRRNSFMRLLLRTPKGIGLRRRLRR